MQIPDETNRISLIPKINHLWDEIKVLEHLIEISSGLDAQATVILIQDYKYVADELSKVLDEYFEYEKANNLPTNLKYKKLRKELKNV